MDKSSFYHPLPQGLTIRSSDIDGLGLFATEAFSAGHEFGVTHVADDRFENAYIRTPLGGFYNHSETPNCEVKTVDDLRILYAIADIAAGDELAVRYTLYDPTGSATG